MSNNLVFVIFGMILLGTFMLMANGLLLENSIAADMNEYYLTAMSLAQSVIDEAKTKAFDQKTVSGPVTSKDSLTSPSNLTREGSGEVVPVPDTLTSQGFLSSINFNDVDDYNGYRRLVNTPRTNGYMLAAAVRYVSSTYPDSASSTMSYSKKMTVTVTSPYFPDSLKVQYIFVY
jgi:hypothetical protein